MAWYIILFLLTFGFFLAKSFISWTFGNMDIDFDGDGDIDTDVSSMFSFKGLLHFLMGFSSYLTLIAKINGVSSGETYQFTVWNYIIAVFIGLLLMVILFYTYKFVMKFNHEQDDIDLNGVNCTILTRNGEVSEFEYGYTVLVHTVNGSRKIDVMSNQKNLKIGSTHIIRINEQGIYYID